MSAPSAGDESISRRSFLGGATTAGAVALSGLKLSPAAAETPAGSGNEALPPTWFEGPDPSIPQAGLRWAFSARVFFADRVMINTMDSPAGRGYTSVGGGDIW
jgi:hypothetical protein